MANYWARIAMGLIFVFATISSPVRAEAVPLKSHDAPVATHAVAFVHMDGMGDACAKAMTAQPGRGKSHKPVPADHSGGCCSNGCNCPLSHCPATPSLLAAEIAAPLGAGTAVLGEREGERLVSFHADTLIRPPRA